MGFVGHRVPLEHPDFGQAFPCSCQEASQAERRMKYAELPNEDNPRTFANLVHRPDVKGLDLARSLALAFTTDTMDPTTLVLQGLNGLGKSHLLEAIGRDMLTMAFKVKYVFVPDLLDKLRDTYDSKNEDSLELVMERYKAPDVLLLDDITEKRVTPFAVAQIERLVDERYRNRRLMVVATNLSDQQMADIWSYRLADRLFDEGTGQVKVVRLSGPSYRTGRTYS